MNGKLTILVCILVAGVIVGASLPIFDSMTASSESIHNEGGGWVRFDLNRSADASYNINVSWDDDGYYIANGSNTQKYDDTTVTDFETIIYADSNVSVWTADGDNILMLGKANGAPVMATFTDPVSIARDSAGVVVSDGTDSYTFGAPAWAYVPQSSGAYGFFNYDAERGVKNPADTPTAVIGGGFAGVYAYNDIYTYDGLGLTMHPIIDAETGLYYGAEWYKDEPINPDDLNITPINPGIIIPGEDSTQGASSSTNPDPGVIDIDDPLNPGDVVMAVNPPTPTYTDGVWGYDLETDNGVQKAVIVKYSGSGGDIVVPATIGGYDVLRVGKASTPQATGYMILKNADISSGSTLTISNGIKQIGPGAFSGANKITSLTLSNTLEWIGDEAFYNCTGLTGALVMPDSLKQIGGGVSNTGVFQGCTHLTSLTLNNGLEKIIGAFRSCTGLTGALVIPDSVTTISGMAFYDTGFTGTLVIPDSVTTTNYSNFSYMRNITSIIIGSGVTTINNGMFCSMLGYIGDFITPSTITAIGEDRNLNGSAMREFGSTNNTGTLVIPETVNTIGYEAFTYSKFKAVVIASDDIPYDNATFSNTSKLTEVLDLSRNVDYSVDRHGIADSVTVSDSIGDTFGYIAVADMGGDGNGTIGDLIALLPVIMMAGIVLFAVVALAINRS